jgi:hypothetical protein
MAGAGSVHVPWYATALRADALEAGLAEIAPLALRYGATSYAVYRYRDDRYKFLQTATFTDKLEWERYWAGDEFSRWRTVHNSHYQVPILYQWADVAAQGALSYDPVTGGAPSSYGDPTGPHGDTI